MLHTILSCGNIISVSASSSHFCLIINHQSLISYVGVGGSTGDDEGRVEVSHGGIWGTVCDNYCDATDASVACRMLGFATGTATMRASFGEGAGDILMNNVQCTGQETSLAHCTFNGWGSHNCRHSEDAGVECSGNGNIYVCLRNCFIYVSTT